MKLPLVCLIVASFIPSSAYAVSPALRESANVQRLFKFSGNLPEMVHRSAGNPVTLHFTMYSTPNGGSPYWQEIQIVQPDAQGSYTVLLGDTTIGGLPADIFVPGGMHWLGVQTSGQPEQPRMLLVEMPSKFIPDTIGPAFPISGKATPIRGTERYITLLLLTMFLVGTLLICLEVIKWWKRRMEHFRPPPFANLINYVPGPERLWRATQVLWFPLSEQRAVSGRPPHSVQNIDDDQPVKAA